MAKIITVDVAQRRVTRDGQELALKPREFDPLRFFVQHPGQVFSREQLLDRVWEIGFVGDKPRLGA